jgi:hypothetical protein
VLELACDADRRLCQLRHTAGDRGCGAARASDIARTTASAELKRRNGFPLAGSFEGEFSEVMRSKGVGRYQW